MKTQNWKYAFVLLATVFIFSTGISTAFAQVDNTPPTMKLVKSVITDDGGNAVPDNWMLFATGINNSNDFSNSGGSGVFETVLANNEYTLSESAGPEGYTSTGIWSCDGGLFTSPNKITMIEGEDVTCTITNDDVAPTLKLVKELVLDDGGTAIPNNWTLTATASAPDPKNRNISTLGGSGDFESVYANIRYELAESDGPSGYTPLNNGKFNCVVTDPSNDITTIRIPIAAITLNEGDSAVCTITNDDIPPNVTITSPGAGDFNGKLKITADVEGFSNSATVTFEVYKIDGTDQVLVYENSDSDGPYTTSVPPKNLEKGFAYLIIVTASESSVNSAQELDTSENSISDSVTINLPAKGKK